MIESAVAIANGKGGVGKTSIAANVAGTAALSGWRVLAVDLDPQGNLGRDLGYSQAGRGDDGRGLLSAVAAGSAVAVVEGVRENLDVVPAGEGTEELEAVLLSRKSRDADAVGAVARALAPVAQHYQLVIIDCPPSRPVLLDAALTAARYVVIPTKGDAKSLDGFVTMARRFGEVRSSTNPELELLGVVLFDFGVKDRRLVQDARDEIERDLAGVAPVFETFIRNSRKAPGDMSGRGLLAYEYENAAATAAPWYKDRAGPRFSRTAGGLASDYQHLTEELLTAIVSRSESGVAELKGVT